MRRAGPIFVLTLAFAATAAWLQAPSEGWPLSLARRLPDTWTRAKPPAPTVVFVVMDTIRADRTSLCGYDKATTPTLQRLASEGASFTCGAHAPGSWTLPSHASYFTGLPVLDHHAHELSGGGVKPGATAERVRPLAPGIPTLAEAMRERGYQALAVSGNPVVSEATGLARGFDSAVAARRFGELRDQTLLDEVERALRLRADGDAPLFLFVNIADAHPPFQAVPESFGIVPATPSVTYQPARSKGTWRRFYASALSKAKRKEFLARINNLYDYGVWRADRTLAGVISRVEDRGWCDAGCRFVVVSDHGEFLGEHGLIDHGHYLWEPDTRVPMLVWEKGTGREAPTLPPVVSAQHAFHLVRDGQLPAEPAPVVSVAWPHEVRCHNTKTFYCQTSAALWEGDQKLVWTDGEMARYDLAADPAESTPLPVEGDARARLDALAARVMAAGKTSEEMDPHLKAMLEAAGYLE